MGILGEITRPLLNAEGHPITSGKEDLRSGETEYCSASGPLKAEINGFQEYARCLLNIRNPKAFALSARSISSRATSAAGSACMPSG